MTVNRWRAVFCNNVDLFESLAGKNSFAFQMLLLVLFSGFVFVRFPVFLVWFGLVIFLLVFVGSLYLVSLGFLIKSHGVSFFLEFLPSGTPIWMAPVISGLEFISFSVRPLVLALRPYVNLSLGVAIMHVIAFSSFGAAFPLSCVWFLWFSYEVFVCFVQWYIVSLILYFTKNG